MMLLALQQAACCTGHSIYLLIGLHADSMQRSADSMLKFPTAKLPSQAVVLYAELWSSPSAICISVVPDHLQLPVPRHLCVPGD